jgi:hypothetical protein
LIVASGVTASTPVVATPVLFAPPPVVALAAPEAALGATTAPASAHAIPTRDDAAVLDRAFDALLEKLAKQKFAATDRPRASRTTKAGRQDPPAAVRRAVWIRDLGRCRYIGRSGHRCEERRFVEFHHKDPRALGGEASIDLIELRCRRYNDYEGRLYFGKRRRTRELVPERVDLSVTHSTH